MRFMKNSFRLEQPKKPAHAISDKERENLIGQDRKLTIVAGIIFILLGLSRVANDLTGFKLQGAAALLETLFVIVVIASVLIQARHLGGSSLSPKDEYEESQNHKARAGAFVFLHSAMFSVVIFETFAERLSLIGLIYLILGVSWLLVAKNSGRTDA